MNRVLCFVFLLKKRVPCRRRLQHVTSSPPTVETSQLNQSSVCVFDPNDVVYLSIPARYPLTLPLLCGPSCSYDCSPTHHFKRCCNNNNDSSVRRKPNKKARRRQTPTRNLTGEACKLENKTKSRKSQENIQQVSVSSLQYSK